MGKTKKVSQEHYRLLIERMCKDEYILACRQVANHAANEAQVDEDLYIYREYSALADNAQKEREKIQAKIDKHEK